MKNIDYIKSLDIEDMAELLHIVHIFKGFDDKKFIRYWLEEKFD